MKNQTWNDIDSAIDRVNAATGGPWKEDRSSDGENFFGFSTQEGYRSVLDIGHDGGCACRRSCELEIEISDSDRAFIAASRTDAAKGLKALKEALDIAAGIAEDADSDPAAARAASAILEAAEKAWDNEG